MNSSTDPTKQTVTIDADTWQFEMALTRARMAMDNWAGHLEEKMKAAAAKTEQETEKIVKRADTMGKKLRDALSGAKESAFVGAKDKLRGIGQAAVNDLAVEAGKAMVNLVARTDDWNKSLKHSESLIKQIGERSEQLASRRAAWIDAAADPAARLKEIDKAMKAAREDYEQTLALKKSHEDLVKRNSTTTDDVAFWAGRQLGMSDPREETKKQIDAFTEQAAAAQKRMEALAEERGKLLNRAADPTFVKGINDTIKALQLQADTYAMNADQVQIYKLRLEGATKEQLEQVMAFQEMAEKGRMMKEIGDITAAIKKQGETFGMTADQIQLYELRAKGASEWMLQAVEKAQQERDAMIALAQAEAAVIAGASIEDAPAGPAADLSRTSSAMTGGSQAAANAIAAARQSTMNANTPQAQNVKATEKVEAKVAALNTKVDELNATMRTVAESLNALSVI